MGKGRDKKKYKKKGKKRTSEEAGIQQHQLDEEEEKIRELATSHPDLFKQILEDMRTEQGADSNEEKTEDERTPPPKKKSKKKKSKSLGEGKPDFKMIKGMSDNAGNIYHDAPGSIYTRDEYRYFWCELPFTIPPIPSKPMKPELIDVVSSEIVGVVNSNASPIEDSKTKQICASQLVRIRAKSNGQGYDFVLAQSRKIVSSEHVILGGNWTKSSVSDLAKAIWDNYTEDKVRRKKDYDTQFNAWLKEMRGWEWEMFLLAQKHAEAITWSPNANKAKILAASFKEEVLLPAGEEIERHPGHFYASTTDKNRSWAHHPRHEF
ncbi:uncharacterized protein TRUGW13939_07205 [Talaromyces rugulosus]|uniref:Uncharacterized protein n=1 Tax=Talaromyces rugulosus TaxID=121627 RepID=A0A7H8R5C9_TALRU|nr:uncharacterized protein TRUGW13939_07205 [Talaromyces rugulosus]QKX60063.1 hypothetical protein TRUGW13939_07205 [Talaromyces rugulosus]